MNTQLSICDMIRSHVTYPRYGLWFLRSLDLVNYCLASAIVCYVPCTTNHLINHIAPHLSTNKAYCSFYFRDPKTNVSVSSNKKQRINSLPQIIPIPIVLWSVPYSLLFLSNPFLFFHLFFFCLSSCVIRAWISDKDISIEYIWGNSLRFPRAELTLG